MEMAVPVGVKKLTLSEDDGFLDQATLESLASKNPDLSSLDFFSEFDDEQPGVDWSRISLPKLQSLDLTYCQLSSINFTAANTPSLQRLVISAAGRSLNSFKVELPDLRLFGCDDTWVSWVEACLPCSITKALPMQQRHTFGADMHSLTVSLTMHTCSQACIAAVPCLSCHSVDWQGGRRRFWQFHVCLPQTRDHQHAQGVGYIGQEAETAPARVHKHVSGQHGVAPP